MSANDDKKVEDSGTEADFGTKDKQESWEDTYFGRVVNDISITDDYCLPPIKRVSLRSF